MNLLAGASQGGSPFDAGGDVNIQAGFARRGVGGGLDMSSGYSEGGSSGPISVQSANAGDEGSSGLLTIRSAPRYLSFSRMPVSLSTR